MNLKVEAARAALAEVSSGMTLGLGTGSTAKEFVALLGQALRDGKLRDIRCTCTSEQTETQAREENIPTFGLAAVSPIDLAVDGADEIDADLRLIKGRGGALSTNGATSAIHAINHVHAAPLMKVKHLAVVPASERRPST